MRCSHKHSIEGEASERIREEWKDFGFKFITSSDYPAVLTHLEENFYQDEPSCRTSGSGTSAERIADMKEWTCHVLDLNQGSFYAYPLEQPDKIAAVLMVWFQEKGVSLPPFVPRSPITVQFGDAAGILHDRYDAHEERRVNVFPELYILSTDKHYRGKGLGTELYRRAIAQLKFQGYPFVYSTFSNPFSRKIGERLGFKEV